MLQNVQDAAWNEARYHTQSQSTFTFCLIKPYQPFSQTRTSDVRTLQRNYFSKHANVIMSQQPLLHALHWLPAQARIDYKLSTVCHNLFLDSFFAYRSDLFTVLFFCRHTDISYPMLTQNPLASAVPLTVLQGSEILPLLISITFNVPMPSKLH